MPGGECQPVEIDAGSEDRCRFRRPAICRSTGRTKVSKAICAVTGSPGRQKIGVSSTVPSPS